jgi:hypothetical protein
MGIKQCPVGCSHFKPGHKAYVARWLRMIQEAAPKISVSTYNCNVAQFIKQSDCSRRCECTAGFMEVKLHQEENHVFTCPPLLVSYKKKQITSWAQQSPQTKQCHCKIPRKRKLKTAENAVLLAQKII